MKTPKLDSDIALGLGPIPQQRNGEDEDRPQDFDNDERQIHGHEGGGGGPLGSEFEEMMAAAERDATDSVDPPAIDEPEVEPATAITEPAARIYRFHPAAEIFPMMSEADLRALADDIRVNGLLDDIVLLGDKIVDGRNRYEACGLAGVTPRFRAWAGSGSVVDWVLSVNLRRRHLTDVQRAVVAARAKDAYAAEAKKRSRTNLLQNKGPTDAADLRRRTAGGSETGRSAKKAAKQLNVKERAVEQAARVLKEGDKALIDAVERGTVSLDAAATVSKLPRSDQRKIVDGGSVKAAAAKIRRARQAKADAPNAPAEGAIGGTAPAPAAPRTNSWVAPSSATNETATFVAASSNTGSNDKGTVEAAEPAAAEVADPLRVEAPAGAAAPPPEATSTSTNATTSQHDTAASSAPVTVGEPDGLEENDEDEDFAEKRSFNGPGEMRACISGIWVTVTLKSSHDEPVLLTLQRYYPPRKPRVYVTGPNGEGVNDFALLALAKAEGPMT